MRKLLEHRRVDGDDHWGPDDEGAVGEALDMDDVVLFDRHVEREEEGLDVVRADIDVCLDAQSLQRLDEPLDVGGDPANGRRVVSRKDRHPHAAKGAPDGS